MQNSKPSSNTGGSGLLKKRPQKESKIDGGEAGEHDLFTFHYLGAVKSWRGERLLKRRIGGGSSFKILQAFEEFKARGEEREGGRADREKLVGKTAFPSGHHMFSWESYRSRSSVLFPEADQCNRVWIFEYSPLPVLMRSRAHGCFLCGQIWLVESGITCRNIGIICIWE